MDLKSRVFIHNFFYVSLQIFLANRNEIGVIPKLRKKIKLVSKKNSPHAYRINEANQTSQE